LELQIIDGNERYYMDCSESTEFAHIEEDPNLNIMGGPRLKLIEEIEAESMVYYL
jgi:hypothetical protein